jgi:Uma2 family endonuclease
MDMALAIPHYTIRDLDSFPDDGNRYELLDGLLLVTPAPAPGHHIVVSRLVTALSNYVRSCGARVYAPGSVEIEPNVHLEPDILVVPASEPIAKRWSEIRAWWLAVEVSGRGSLVYDCDFKYRAYSALGVRDAWRVDLRDRGVVVKTGAGVEKTYEGQFEWHPPEIECPLIVDVQSLFDEVQGDS